MKVLHVETTCNYLCKHFQLKRHKQTNTNNVKKFRKYSDPPKNQNNLKKTKIKKMKKKKPKTKTKTENTPKLVS